jgi:hypothetical protein
VNVAIVTKVYNERINLPIWIRHYSAQCPDAALFVLDHGSGSHILHYAGTGETRLRVIRSDLQHLNLLPARI